MDALSDVLRSVSLSGAVFFEAEFHAPWCVRAHLGLGGVRDRLPADSRVALFHWLTEGHCKVRLAEEQGEQALEAGDLVLFTNDDPHLLGTDLGRLPVESQDMFEGMPGESCARLRLDGEGEATRFVCGYIAFDRTLSRTLVDSLPRMLRVPIRDRPAAGLVRSLLFAAVEESASARPGGLSMLAKLSELLFIEALRCHVEALPEGGTGWLAGLRDPHVGQALALLHGSPRSDWTVESLAARVALSRSALGERFNRLVGESPMAYLTRWRLAQAARELLRGAPVGRVADRWGYASDAAFSRAFRREFGDSPANWRARRAGG